MGFVKTLFRTLWGVNEPSVELTPPIECEACSTARVAGKDACPEHHTHHMHAHRDEAVSTSEKPHA